MPVVVERGLLLALGEVTLVAGRTQLLALGEVVLASGQLSLPALGEVEPLDSVRSPAAKSPCCSLRSAIDGALLPVVVGCRLLLALGEVTLAAGRTLLLALGEVVLAPGKLLSLLALGEVADRALGLRPFSGGEVAVLLAPSAMGSLTLVG